MANYWKSIFSFIDLSSPVARFLLICPHGCPKDAFVLGNFPKWKHFSVVLIYVCLAEDVFSIQQRTSAQSYRG